MTILDMLDQLEAEIVSLRARNRALELASPAPSHHASPPAIQSARIQPKKKAQSKTTQRKTSREITEPPPQQLAFPETKSDESRSATGKRQALGRSIVQLRRPSSVNPS